MADFQLFIFVNKASLLITTVVITAIVGGFFLYQHVTRKSEVRVWDIIPEQTIAVYEYGECEICFDQIAKSPIGLLLRQLTTKRVNQDSIARKIDFLFQPQRDKFISLHITKRNDLDFVYYFPVSSQQLSVLNTGNIKEREFNGFKIYEVKFGESFISYVILENIVVVSFTSFLVEDVIRAFTTEAKIKFKDRVSDVFLLPKIKNDPGNIYVSTWSINRLLKVFTGLQNDVIPLLAQASLLDIKSSGNSITLNGFTSSSSENNALLNAVNQQSPVSLISKNLISNRALAVLNYGISDGSTLFQHLNKFSSSSDRDSLSSLVKVNFESLLSSVKQEITLCYFESKSDSPERILFFRTNKQQLWTQVLDGLSKAAEKADTVFYERYGSYDIREVEIGSLPQKFFYPLLTGFDQTYYTAIDDVFILAERLEELKLFLDDIDKENVWGKSLYYNRFFESTLLESNLSLYINTPKALNFTFKKLDPSWQDFVAKNQSIINAIDFTSIQFSYLNESFYTNLSFNFHEVDFKSKIKESVSKVVVPVEHSIFRGPFIVRTHASRNPDLVIQDSLNLVYYFSAEGKLLWKRQVDGEILGQPGVVDFYNNGKLQLGFCAAGKVHIIDRLGNSIDQYPIPVVSQISWMEVVDYDNSKNYRYLITDKNGKLWLYDKTGKLLDGWRPNSADGILFTSAKHHRIRGKDFIVTVRQDGNVIIFNRRGEKQNGFPLNLEARPEGEYFLEAGSSLEKTYFVCVSRDGFRIKFNPLGKLISKETLIKPSIDTYFELIAEENGKSYLIKRQNAKQLVLLREDGAEFITNSFVGTNPCVIRFYDFGAGRTYVTITDRSQELTYVYDASGKLVTQIPIDSNAVTISVDDSGKAKLYVAFEKSLTILDLP